MQAAQGEAAERKWPERTPTAWSALDDRARRRPSARLEKVSIRLQDLERVVSMTATEPVDTEVASVEREDLLKAAIAQLLEELNNRPFKKLEGCRRSRFLELDQPALRPLAPQRYEFGEWRRAKAASRRPPMSAAVGSSCHGAPQPTEQLTGVCRHAGMRAWTIYTHRLSTLTVVGHAVLM